MILSTAAIYSWNIRSKMNVRNYFIQEWQIYSKWCADSNCSRLPGVCAEKNMGTYCRLGGKKCHDWFSMSAMGTSARYLPTLTWFSPTTFTAGNIDAGRFKKNCPKTRSMVLAETHWNSPSPDSVPGALGWALDLPLELSWETCQIALSLWLSFWPCFSVSYHLCT